MVRGKLRAWSVAPSKPLLSWQQRAPCLGWLCCPGVQLSGAVWVDGCLIANSDLAAHHRWAPKDLGLQACPSVLVEHKECFYGLCPWRVALALGWQLLDQLYPSAGWGWSGCVSTVRAAACVSLVLEQFP